MIEKLQDLETRYNELTHLLSDPEIATDYQKYQKHAKARAEIEEIVTGFRQYKSILQSITETKAILSGEESAEMQAMAREELEKLEKRKTELEQELERMLIPKDPLDEKGIIVEIRAGTGGEESALFAAELFRMYSKYAERQGWKIGVIDSNPTGLGGFKEIIASIEGYGVYSRLKYESGVHRVQRVPVTEASGRIHTSAVTIAILPEVEDVEVEIDHQETFNLKKLAKLAKSERFQVLEAEKFMMSPVGFPAELKIEKLMKKIGLGFILLNQLVVARKIE